MQKGGRPELSERMPHLVRHQSYRIKVPANLLTKGTILSRPSLRWSSFNPRESLTKRIYHSGLLYLDLLFLAIEALSSHAPAFEPSPVSLAFTTQLPRPTYLFFKERLV